MSYFSYYTFLANREQRPSEDWTNVVPDEPFLDLVAPSVRHEVARDIDEMYEELSIKVTPP